MFAVDPAHEINVVVVSASLVLLVREREGGWHVVRPASPGALQRQGFQGQNEDSVGSYTTSDLLTRTCEGFRTVYRGGLDSNIEMYPTSTMIDAGKGQHNMEFAL